MIIKFLRIKNIRSYSNAQVEFPRGSVLLSGDIGAGKSTVLIAIEFAFFGIKRGDISGAALLRHGAKEGFVELNFEIDGKDITIKRSLKRTSTTIKQEPGYIIIDGSRQDLTPEELKSRILDILGYPKGLLKKGKDLVYRFTVYTPQEQMKAILMESPEERLDTLRKVFGIDRYKRIRENAMDYVSGLKSEIRELKGKTFGLDEKIKIRDSKAEELKEIKDSIKGLLPVVEEKSAALKKAREELDGHEKKIDAARKIKNEMTVIETQLMNNFLQRKKNSEIIAKTAKVVHELEKELGSSPKDDISPLIEQKKKDIDDLEAINVELNRVIAKHSAAISSAQAVIGKISGMDHCPTCDQDVDEKHKENIAQRENLVISKNISEKENLEEKYFEINSLIKKGKDDLSNLHDELTALAVIKQKMVLLDDKRAYLSQLEKEQDEIKRCIAGLNKDKMVKAAKLEGSESIGQAYKEIKEKLLMLDEDERKASMQYSNLNVKAEEYSRLLHLYDEEIDAKRSWRKKIEKTAKLISWFEDYFLKLMVVMEKHVMSQIYLEFNELFIEWFRMLIEDETMNVRIDDSFSPVIEQDGFETSVSNLSGGEKTSVALAYRLALNKVINDFITHIKTRDIIMLDEPTDGFSDAQLDRVREVLDEINAKQIIIVSHESKIESFVDNIIMVEKDNHVSSLR